MLESLNALIKTSKANIKADFSALENVNFNRTYLESIFLNLITNSIKYGRPGVLPQVNIRSATVNGVGQLSFTDNGLGFDMDKVKDKIFGLHQKFHDHGDSKGIGLYLVYNHVTSLGGNITVDSVVDEGTTFTITFKQ